MDNRLGLYIHIPFCANRCNYCDFYSCTNPTKMDEYLSALLEHIKETATFTGKKTKNGGYIVDSVYFGGGTPSFFGEKRLCKVLDAIKKQWNFSQKTAEITLEANPDSVDFKMLKKLYKAGFNRISIGLQASQQQHLNLLGRIHNTEQAADAVRNAKKAKFDNINVDLMYGLPNQTIAHIQDAIETVSSWDVQHISVYGLNVEDGTPLAEQNYLYPDDDTQAEMYLGIIDMLAEKGFMQYEISNFSLRGMESKHNSKYWMLEPFIGFGPSAHSDFGGKRYGNVRDMEAYISGVKNGDSVIESMEIIGALERAGEYVMCGLRMCQGISSNEYTRLYHVSFEPIERKLEKFLEYKLCTRSGDRWNLTPTGFLVSNKILSELLESPVTDNKDSNIQF